MEMVQNGWQKKGSEICGILMEMLDKYQENKDEMLSYEMLKQKALFLLLQN